MRSLVGDLVLVRLQEERDPLLHKRLYNALRRAILDGSLAPQSRLPPSRDLAGELGVSRNTILTTYEQLLAGGYVVSRRGSGTFGAQTAPESSLTAKGQQENSSIAAPTAHLSRRGQHLLGQVSASPRQWGAFIPGVPDVNAFPHPLFSKIQARISRRPKPERLSYSCNGGTPELQQALVDYLRVSRGVHCQSDQILITEGIHQAIDLVTRMLCDNGDLAWVEEPSYWGIRHVLAMNDVRAEPLTVDANGLCPPETVDDAPRLIFVTPSHQYPLGAVMSLERRQRLLALARQQGSWIVEDDYDSEFRFSGQPIPALQGLVADAPVVYIGTFSKTLYPGLRLGYVVIPRPLVSDLKHAHAELYRGGHSLIQMALAEFITAGHYSAHIRRMRLLYSRRRAFLTELIQQHCMPYALSDFSDNAGLHLILNLPAEADDVAIAREANARHILVRPLSRYYLTAARKKGLLMGFASQPEEQMASAFSVLLGCLQTHCPQMLLLREDAEKQNAPT
ncbi:PLP-dependent aminotransferase family protein [Klebsiella pneumoniae]|uniref:MocR-like pyridoxine biosynthesis transcription factor PdxR n=1 Tax=Klebsiella pneumoniae TaxID=573 RepID=UPI00109CEA63|nr:PLP-dependent aminotransferase family protein [Klebsiella pneumoniae]THB49041.1 PLP-dependent aminotransferase family protein [Klebsiella pneumoniae]